MDNKTEVCRAINEIVAEKLTQEERAALASLLASFLDAEDEQDEEMTALVYLGAVDFLWMAWRITLDEKHQLLDLGG